MYKSDDWRAPGVARRNTGAPTTTAIKERVGFIEKLVESSIDRIMVLDDNLNYIFWNRNCEQYYGIKKEDIIGKICFRVFSNV